MRIVCNVLVYWLPVLCLFTLSCRKPKQSIPYVKLNPGTTYPLHAITFINADTGFAVGGSRYSIGIVLKTTNGGNHWSVDSMSTKINFDAHFWDSRRGIVVGFDGRIHRCFDGGQTWDYYQTAYWHPLRDVFFVNDTLGFIVGGTGYRKGSILKTTNGGNLWSEDTIDRELRSIFFVNERTGYAAGYGIILKTENGGESWQPTGAEGDFFTALFFTDEKTGYAVGTGGSIIKTTDGGLTWKRKRKGNVLFKKRTNLQALFFTNTQKGYAVGMNGALVRTTDGGENWEEIEPFTSENFYAITAVNPNVWVVVGDNGSMYRLIDE